LAIVAHHPQAVYFGMKSGILPRTAKEASDELIAGTDRDPALLDQLTDAEPPEGEAAGEGEPALAGA
jgi:5-methyltetrahydrofolate--homocysteine methyltransferase